MFNCPGHVWMAFSMPPLALLSRTGTFIGTSIGTVGVVVLESATALRNS